MGFFPAGSGISLQGQTIFTFGRSHMDRVKANSGNKNRKLNFRETLFNFTLTGASQTFKPQGEIK